MKKLTMSICIVMALLSSASASDYGPACRDYGINFYGDEYQLQFACIASPLGVVNFVADEEAIETYIYLFDGQSVNIIGLTSLRYDDNALVFEGTWPNLVFEAIQ